MKIGNLICLNKNTSYFRFLLTVIFCLFLIIFIKTVNYTYSYFYDKASSYGNCFTTANVTDFLELKPGKAKAIFPAGDSSCEVLPAAFKDYKNKIFINLGEVVQGESKNFVDLLKISNISSKNIVVNWEVQGEIVSLIDNVKGNFILLPIAKEQKTTEKDLVFLNKGSGTLNNSPYSFDLNLKINVNTEPNVYKGILHITVDGNFLTVDIPVQLIVREKNKEAKVIQMTVEKDAYNQGSETIAEHIYEPNNYKNNPEEKSVDKDSLKNNSDNIPVNETPKKDADKEGTSTNQKNTNEEQILQKQLLDENNTNNLQGNITKEKNE